MEVKLHDIGEGMTEANISSFLVKPGDIVKADDPLIEIQTDKMTAEIPAPKNGIVKEFMVAQGQLVSVGTTLLLLEDVHSIEMNITQPPDSKKENFTVNSDKKKRIMASPYTRKIAREHNVQIKDIEGTGPAGRITDEDVYRYIQLSKKLVETVGQQKEEHKNDQIGEKIPFRGRRKQIAKRMTQSVYTIPHCTLFEEVDVTNLIQFRNELKTTNIHLSLTAFFIKAISLSLKDYKIFNAKLEEEQEFIHILNEHHIGIATDTPEGLIVPVIHHVEQKTITAIHEDLKELTHKAVENALSIKEITGGSFTISNVGPLGGSIGATPIIQHPEVGLMSFHKTKKMPVVVKDDQIAIRSIMNISMSFDHRVADGATAVAFTNRFAQFIKNPNLMLLEMI
ncbi:dihydrolipoamide acetyltransferase family protein [Ferdinandcohnia quinoae]|uniref:Dihydrolipoamide acetyltransferase component of pyruvate dehydrogenase complex n=1 Tax=Fredinandcohnia quinoae TaxID=2918902 RepID=A0AAW5EDY2_9BACI|nr:2-oxo acid dehydrogenase subunit E2 [Fredinandcohnia sp. SECRCQ15]